MRLKTDGFEEQLEFQIELGETAAGLSYVPGRINGSAVKVAAFESSGSFHTQLFFITRDALQASVHDNSEVGRVYLCVDGSPTIDSGSIDTTVFGLSAASMSFGITSDGYWTVEDGKGRRRSGPAVPGTNSVTDIPVVAGQYYCLEVGINRTTISGSTRNTIVYRIDGVQVSCRRVAGSALTSGSWYAKCVGSGSEANPSVYVDDFALNDFYGSEQNTWPGPGHTVLCMPSAVSTSGHWTTGTSFNAKDDDHGTTSMGSTDECYVRDVTNDDYNTHNSADSGGRNNDKLVAISHVPQMGGDNLQGNYNVGGQGYAFGENRMLSNPNSWQSKDFFARAPTDQPKPPGCDLDGKQYDNLYIQAWRAFNLAPIGDSITAAQDTSLIEGAIAVTYARPCFGRGNETGADGTIWESIFDTHTTGNVDVTALGQTVTRDVGSASAGYNYTEIMAYGATPTDIVLTRQTANKFVLNVSAMWTLVECMAEVQEPFPTACTGTAGPLICFV